MRRHKRGEPWTLYGLWETGRQHNEKRRYAMGDKGKKDKDKARKQKIKKQEQIAKKNLEKLPTKTPA
jgi:hypothetical protein